MVYKANVTDALSGYYAWKREVVETIMPYLDSEGFSIEMEMIIKMERMGYDMYSVPITYELREGESKINSFSDAVGIVLTMIRNIRWKSPHRVMHRQHRMVTRSVYGL